MAERFKAPVLKDERYRIVECRDVPLCSIFQALFIIFKLCRIGGYWTVLLSLGTILGPSFAARI